MRFNGIYVEVFRLEPQATVTREIDGLISQEKCEPE